MMKPTIKIYIGRPVSGAEAHALIRLHRDLNERGVDALLLVNFISRSKSRQIDCVAVTANQATLLDFKEITGVLRGSFNGLWLIRSLGGSEVRYPGENPYREVSTAKYALSDDLAAFRKSRPEVPHPKKGHFYTQFDAAVCICPDILSGSQLPQGDYKCWIWGYPTALERITSRAIDSSWSPEHWEKFARDFLHLEEASLESATDSQFRASEQLVFSYRSRLESILQHKLPPRLPDSQALPYNEHFTVVGPSGIGKTVHLQWHALECSQLGRLVLFAEAKHYAGDFKALMQKSIAPFFSGRIEDLLSAASLCANATDLIIDGECKDSLQPTLVRDLLAFHERRGARIISANQGGVELPPDICASRIEIRNLTQEQKIAAFAYHTGVSDFEVDAEVLDPFDTAHDLMVAARCGSKLRSGASRSDLYDAYILQSLPTANLSVAGALCRHLAAALSSEYATVMSIHLFEELSASFLTQCGSHLHVLDELRQSALFKLDVASFSFSHDKIQQHLYGDWLYRNSPDFASLLLKLRNPAHRELAELALSRERLIERVVETLRAVPELGLFDRVGGGACGSAARDVLLQECHRLLSEAAADLATISVKLNLVEQDGRKIEADWPTLTGNREWSEYEVMLCRWIGRHLETHGFADRVAELLALTGASLQQASENAAIQEKVHPLAVLGSVLHTVLALQHVSMALPASEIYHAWRVSRFVGKTGDQLPMHWAKSLTPYVNCSCLGTVGATSFVLAEIGKHDDNLSPKDLAGLFKQAWNTKLRPLRMQALELLRDQAQQLRQKAAEELQGICIILEQVHAASPKGDLIMNTCLIETMNAYGLISPPVDFETACNQIRGVLDKGSAHAKVLFELAGLFPAEAPEDPLAEEGYRIVGLFFEEVYQGIYFDAFEQLSRSEQVAFMNLAANARDPFFHLEWILTGLVESQSPCSADIFRKYAGRVLCSTWISEHDIAGIFTLAVTGCAKVGAELPPWEMENSIAAEAWRIMREIVYLISRGAPSSVIEESWLVLRSEAILGAADVLFLLAKTKHAIGALRSDVNVRVTELYPEHTRCIMAHSLNHVGSLVAVGKFAEREWHTSERTRYIIESLGELGNESTIEQLKALASDERWGAVAVSAIKSIRNRLDQL
jgi:hypothetical protein